MDADLSGPSPRKPLFSHAQSYNQIENTVVNRGERENAMEESGYQKLLAARTLNGVFRRQQSRFLALYEGIQLLLRARAGRFLERSIASSLLR